jgi:hypothetical protein
MTNNRAIPIFRVISKIPDIFVAYDHVAINGSRLSPIICVADNEDGSRLVVQQSNINGTDIVIHVAMPIDDDLLRASYVLSFKKEIVVLKINNDILQNPRVIAIYDDINEDMIINNNDNEYDDAVTIFDAHQDLFEELLYLE